VEKSQVRDFPTWVENHSAPMLRRARVAVLRSYSRGCEVGGSFSPCATQGVGLPFASQQHDARTEKEFLRDVSGSRPTVQDTSLLVG
jgi:hypothetical protein